MYFNNILETQCINYLLKLNFQVGILDLRPIIVVYFRSF